MSRIRHRLASSLLKRGDIQTARCLLPNAFHSSTYTVRDRAGTEFTGVTFDRVVDALVAEDSSRALEQTDFGSS